MNKAQLYELRFEELEKLLGRSLEEVMGEISDDIEYKFTTARGLMVSEILDLQKIKANG